jgi:hypothetical protein
MAVLLLGSVTALFLYVPVVPVAMAVVILLSFVLMFLLGIQAGGRRLRIRPAKRISRVLGAAQNW